MDIKKQNIIYVIIQWYRLNGWWIIDILTNWINGNNGIMRIEMEMEMAIALE